MQIVQEYVLIDACEWYLWFVRRPILYFKYSLLCRFFYMLYLHITCKYYSIANITTSYRWFILWYLFKVSCHCTCTVTMLGHVCSFYLCRWASQVFVHYTYKFYFYFSIATRNYHLVHIKYNKIINSVVLEFINLTHTPDNFNINMHVVNWCKC